MLTEILQFLTQRFYILGLIPPECNAVDSSDARRVKWIKFRGYKKNWLADPFILSVDDESVTLFAEEMDSATQKGRLVKVVVDRISNKIVDRKIILELETHLSFPIIFRSKGDVYVYPENYESGTLKIYKYNPVTDKLENPVEIIREPLLDTQIIELDGLYYAFAVKFQDGTQNDTRQLRIYKSPTLFGQYELVQLIDNPRCEERGAGAIFFRDGKIIRPAQCCEGDYGRNVIFYELILEKDGFHEKEIGRLNPHHSHPEGLHTYNCYNEDVTVIDSCAYAFGNILSYIKTVFR